MVGLGCAAAAVGMTRMGRQDSKAIPSRHLRNCLLCKGLCDSFDCQEASKASRSVSVCVSGSKVNSPSACAALSKRWSDATSARSLPSARSWAARSSAACKTIASVALIACFSERGMELLMSALSEGNLAKSTAVRTSVRNRVIAAENTAGAMMPPLRLRTSAAATSAAPQHQTHQPVACSVCEKMVNDSRPSFIGISLDQCAGVKQKQVHPFIPLA